MPSQGIHKASRRELLIILVLAAIPLAVKVARYPDYPGSDDAFIHLSIVRNLSHGFGWGIAQGTRVNMSTSPLFTMLLAGLASAGLSGIVPGQVVSGICAMVGIVCIHRVTVLLCDVSWMRILSVVLAAFQVHLWRWTGVVMETTMTSVFVVVAFYAYYHILNQDSDQWQRWFVLGMILGGGYLVRPELGILLATFLISLFFVPKQGGTRAFVSTLGGFAVVAGSWVGFCHLYFGSIEPTSYYAKTTAFHVWNQVVAKQIGEVILSGCVFSLLLICTLATGLAWSTRREGSRSRRHELLPALVFPLALLGFYLTKTTYLQSPGRYCLPAVSTIPFVVSILGREYRGAKRLPVIKVFGILCLCGHVAMMLYVNEKYIVPVLRDFKGNYWSTMRQAASAVGERCKAGDKVLVETDIGVVSYEAHGVCEVADGGGLASPELQGLSLREQMARSGAEYVIQSLGSSPHELARGEPSLIPMGVWPFRSHSVGEGGRVYYCNLYRVSHPGGL